MTKSKVATLVVVVMVLVLPALSGAAGQTTVTSVYTVDGKVSGFNTGLVLTDGMSVTATAHRSGLCLFEQFLYQPERRRLVWDDQQPVRRVRAPWRPSISARRSRRKRPMDAGRDRLTTLSGTGALVFSVNDYYSTFWDNSGSFSVTVTRSSVCFPGSGRGDKKHSHVGPPGLLDSCYPGNGYGDSNHSHAGPPGLTDNPSGGRKAGGASGSKNGSKAGEASGSNNGSNAGGTLRPTATASTLPATLLTPHSHGKEKK